jgi:predicted NAD/FAD-dependent oxidoreductase
MTRIGIVGAGAGGAAAAWTLDREAPEATVTVLEKSRGVCGRAATRRKDGCHYDYGANYLKSDDERVTELVTETLPSDDLVDIAEPIYTFDADGEVSPGRDADDHKWTYRDGITRLAKHLFADADAEVRNGVRAETLERLGGREDGRWRVTDTDGETHGPFDVLLLNPPAAQTADLLADAAWASETRDDLEAAARDVPYRTIWAAILHYPFEVDVPYYGLVNPGKDHEVGWISREECKPGHVPDGESLLVVQANEAWSLEHYDDDPASNVAGLTELTADVLGEERLRDPDWTDHQRWTYALAEDGVEEAPLRAAEAEGLYCAGDWVAGAARLHAALRSGLDVGERVAAEEV